MRVTVFFLLLGIIQVSAINSYSQQSRISIKLSNVSLSDVLNEIEEHSDFYFLYNQDLIDVNRKVSLNAENQSIDKILDQLFGRSGVKYVIKDRQIILTSLNGNLQPAQQKEIRGKVTDPSGIPLPGVTVVVKGTTQGIITDADGNYILNKVPGDATLVFSFVGMKTQEIPVSGRITIDVVMQEETVGIEEVVAIGYGTQSRSTVTSAVSKVDAENIRSTSDVNPIKALQGKAAGVDVRVTSGMPGSAATVIIRGGTSTDPDEDTPLYIIDGVIRSITDINAEDIESIQVLKDAASTAIYGARGANGIIIITTKNGKDAGNGQINFSYSTQVETLAKSYPFTSAEDYLRVSRIAANLGLDLSTSASRLSDGAYPYSTNNISNTAHGGGFMNSKHTVEFLDDLINAEGEDLVNDLLNNQGYQTMTDPVTNRELIFYDNHYDDVMFRTGITNNYDLNFSTGNEKMSIYTGLGYVNQEGIVRGTYYDRLSFLINTSYKVRDNLNIEAGVDYKYAKYRGPKGYTETVNRSSRLPHTCRMYYPDGTPAIGENGSSPRNILHELYYEHYSTKTYRTTMRFGLDWEITEGLHFRPSGSVYLYQYMYNFFEEYNDFNTGRDMSSKSTLNRQYMVDMILSYDKTFNKEHNISLMAGSNLTDANDFTLNGSGGNAPTDYISTLNASDTDEERVSSEIEDDRLLSFFGRANYDYKKKYIFSASGRVDGSSKFSEDHKWAFFPAFSAGWNIHNENFWTFEKINKLKARVSWGESGNNNLELSDTQGAYSPGYDYGGESGLLNTSLANTSLKWETTRSIDIGFDAGLFENRLTVYADYYSKLTKDKLTEINLPRESGFTSIMANYGTIRNRGFEIEAAYDIIRKNNMKWNLAANFSFNRLVVVKLPDNGKVKNRINGGEIYDKKSGEYKNVGGYAEGERIGGIWAFHMIGVYSTDEEAKSAPYDTKVSGTWLTKSASEQKVGGDAIWEDVDSNGEIDDRDLVFRGYASPDKVGGIVNTFSWKGLSVRLVMDYALGHVICNGWRARANGNARNRVMTITDVNSKDMWWNQGDNAKIPRYSVASDWDNGKRNHVRQVSYSDVGPSEGTYATANSLYIQKGNFLAFREFSVTYNLPKNISNKLYLNNIALDASIYNIGYITGYDGISPENYDGGEEGDYYRPRQFKFGVKLSF